MNQTIKTILWSAAATLLLVVATVVSYRLGRRSMPVIEKTTVDTVIIRETVRDTILVPKVRYIARTDTVYLTISGDTTKIKVEVPIERKVYQTEDYRAVVEGFRPRLTEMEVYRQTHYITQTQTIKVPDKRRWGVGVQAGYGYIPTQNKFQPYIGVGIQYSVFAW